MKRPRAKVVAKMTKNVRVSTRRDVNGKKTHAPNLFLTKKSHTQEALAFHKHVLDKCIQKVGDKGLASVPKLYQTDGMGLENVKVQLIFWCPVTRATWWITERDDEDPDVFFGFVSVVSGGGELGYFRLSDIAEYCALAGAAGILEDFTSTKGFTVEEVQNSYNEGKLLF
jgi:hypothetical protein